jgi:acetyl-CoA acetyltransferase
MANVVDLGGAAAAGMVWRAAAAIAAGMCETVLCVLANTHETTPPRSPNRNPIREFDVPFGASGANVSYAMIKEAHIAAYGCGDPAYAEIAVRARANAQRNPEAIFHGKPIGVEDVLASPIIASPLHLLEIVMPVAGGAAVIVTGRDNARRLPHPAVHLLGAGEKVTHRALSQAPSLTSGPLRPAMAQALAQARAAAAEMDLLSLYDCYTIMVATTLEDLGLCPPGGFGDWLAEHDTSPEGDAPLNTHGGQLGFGQPDLAGGMTHLTEAVRQLRGTADGRQIPDARLALVTGNGATMSEATALVLGAD